MTRVRVLPLAFVLLCLTPCLPVPPIGTAQAAIATPFLDAHTHIVRYLRRGRSLEAAAAEALRLMDRFGETAGILAPPPFPPDRQGAYGVRQLSSLVHDHPGRFAFTAGGDSLNPMIQQTPPDQVTPDVLRRFAQAAEAIVRGGAAGFGELAAEHFSARTGSHPYESAPPDHPLFLALADIAAHADVPIELHMEAVPRDMPFPNLALMGPPNPPAVRENISALERLLEHNPKTRVIWLHAGWDLSGYRTVPLMRSLLSRHPNLYMSLKVDKRGAPPTSPFAPGGGLKPGWAALLRDFPDRLVIGSDQFFDEDPQRIAAARRIVDALPPEVVRLITIENVKRLYHVPSLMP